MKRVFDTLAALSLVIMVAAGACGPALAQSLEPGRLLVATPDMQDDNFAKSVVLLLHHDENGALGVVVNRPTWVKPHEVDPDFGDLQGYDGAVYLGGPASATQMIFLVRDPPAGAIDAKPIFDHVYASGNPDQLPKLIQASPDAQKLRLYAGHAEWGRGQLEREIAAGQWVVVDGSPDRIFSPDPTTLWDRIFHQGSEVTVQATPWSTQIPAAPSRAELSPLRLPRLAAASRDPR
jgi:putative transcriptional regulator